MKRILVAGGAGFIGTNLCRRLVKDKNNFIFCLDNLITGSINNIQDLIKLDNFKFINEDITNKIDIPVDEIYNAACAASPQAYQLNPIHTTMSCVLGTKNLLDLAVKYNSKIMHFSTSEVYGNPLVHPQVETYNGNVNPIGIRACYDEGKRCSETLCFDYNRVYSLDVKVIRIFNTYGPYMDKNDGRVVSNFINQALKNKDLTIYGDGTQTRSFQYIDDLVDGIITFMQLDNKNFCGPLNLGNPEEFTIKELADIVLDKIECNSSIIYTDLPKDAPVKRKPNIALATLVLNGWKPKVKLNYGLDKTIEYFKNMEV